MRADRPSSTARLIARSLLLSAQHPRRRVLVQPGVETCLTNILAHDESAAWFEFALRHPWAARWIWRAEHLILPGIVTHYLARKRWIENAVSSTLRQGCNQVVILGAGFDPLAWRLHRDWPEVLFWELDHPATQAPKARAFDDEPNQRADNLTLLPADLALELPLSVLHRSPNFQPARRTCFVAEGLLMYFTASRVSALWRDLTQVSAATLVFTFMEPGSDGRAAFRGHRWLIDRWLRLKREPFAWASSRVALTDGLHAAGWHLDSIAAANELHAAVLVPAGLPDAPLAEGECCAQASHEPTDEQKRVRAIISKP